MPTGVNEPAAWLVLGGLHLLNGAAPVRPGDVLVLAAVPPVEAYVPSNTIVLRWSDLGPVRLRAVTADGTARAEAAARGADLFPDMRPGPELRRLVERAGGDAASPLVPLFYLRAV